MLSTDSKWASLPWAAANNSFKPSQNRGSAFVPALRWHAVAAPFRAGVTQAFAIAPEHHEHSDTQRITN